MRSTNIYRAITISCMTGNAQALGVIVMNRVEKTLAFMKLIQAFHKLASRRGQLEWNLRVQTLAPTHL